ncbi:DMT family transporter [Bosea sp. BK604]|uniref:DMT family transporter n=1 Tax=Bosea sp. BK604 TaxID=2512180 RepID=UPI00104CED82|nr:DMT family transporter [Bosea sp. BK604]TCR70420.1 threonine/homoserine efflux transporter RhtA [Bosea sp. BK604]
MSPPSSAVIAADTDAFATALKPVQHVPAAPAGVTDNTLVAIGLILASTLFFAAGDVTAKLLTGSLPGLQVTWLRYVVFALLVVPATLLVRGRSGLRTKSIGMQSLRGIAVAGSAVLFVSGLTMLPVAEATAINFISPIFITALSIPLLGEKVGIRRWAAAAVGFAGVLIVVQPGGSSFSAAALLPMGAAMSWAIAAIVTRKMHAERPEVTLAWSAMIGLVVLSLGVPFVWKNLTLHEIGIGVLMGLFSTVGHGLVVLAFKKAPASVLAPFSYVQLASSSLFSFLMFAAVPQAMTFFGGAVIAASGLYTAHRERVRAKTGRNLRGV